MLKLFAIREQVRKSAVINFIEKVYIIIDISIREIVLRL